MNLPTLSSLASCETHSVFPDPLTSRSQWSQFWLQLRPHAPAPNLSTHRICPSSPVAVTLQLLSSSSPELAPALHHFTSMPHHEPSFLPSLTPLRWPAQALRSLTVLPNGFRKLPPFPTASFLFTLSNGLIVYFTERTVTIRCYASTSPLCPRCAVICYGSFLEGIGEIGITLLSRGALPYLRGSRPLPLRWAPASANHLLPSLQL